MDWSWAVRGALRCGGGVSAGAGSLRPAVSGGRRESSDRALTTTGPNVAGADARVIEHRGAGGAATQDGGGDTGAHATRAGGSDRRGDERAATGANTRRPA